MRPTIDNIVRNTLLNQWQIEHILRQIPFEERVKPINMLAVDGDIIAYRTAAVCEEHFEGACASIIDTTLRDIATDTGVSHMRIYLSGEKNFRYDVGKTKPYKGNRATMVRPKYLDYCKKYLEEKYLGIRMDGYEADDGIASDMVQNGAFHCGIDKDMLQVPGKHYNYVNKTWREVGEEESVMILYRQILMGDNADNIPGLPKVGEKTAEKAIQNFMTAYDDCREMYEQVCAEKMPDVDPIEYMAEQESLVTMIRDCQIDFSRTVYIEPNTEGFEVQEGGFQGV